MAKIRVNHFAAKTLGVGITVDWEALVIEVFIAFLLAVFAYMGYLANIGLLLFPCAIGSVLCFFAFLHSLYLVVQSKREAKQHREINE